jgi:hypothetical protein
MCNIYDWIKQVNKFFAYGHVQKVLESCKNGFFFFEKVLESLLAANVPHIAKITLPSDTFYQKILNYHHLNEDRRGSMGGGNSPPPQKLKNRNLHAQHA